MPRKINRNTLFSIIISVSIILFLIFRVGAPNIWAQIKKLDLFLFIIACTISLPNNAVRAFRWSRILKAQKISLSPSTALQYFLMGLYAAVLTPGRIGDLLRAYLISRKEKKSFGFITASVVFDRLLDLGTMLGIAVLGVLFFIIPNIDPEQQQDLTVPILFLTIFAVLGVFLVYIVFSTNFGKQFLSKFGAAFIRLMPKRFAQKINLDNELNDFFEAIDLYRINYANLSLAAVSSIFAWLIYGFQGYILFLAFGGENASFLILTFFVAFTSFATLIPFTISGWGMREALFIILFSFVGIPQDAALSFSIVFVLIAAWIPAMFGGFLLSKVGISRHDLTETSKNPQE